MSADDAIIGVSDQIGWRSHAPTCARYARLRVSSVRSFSTRVKSPCESGCSAEMRDVLNARIKRRETFRPFAPSVLAEATGEWFERAEPSPFMTMTYRVTPGKRALVPAPTHVDGTGRLQTVERDTQPRYWWVIKEFERLTGVPMVLNTSFNENEPIVCTPAEAIDCFLRTRMDVLAIGGYVVSRATA